MLEGTNLKIVSLEEGVLTYQDNGVLCEKKLSKSEKIEEGKTEAEEKEEEVTKEYTELECNEIPKSNYNAYFSTGMKVKNSYTLEMKFQLTDENGCGRFLNYAPYKGSMIHLSQESTRGIRAGSSWYVKNITDTDISKSFVYRKEKREIYLDGTKMMTCPEMEFETVSELLFGSGKGRIYYFKIWDENGTLMKDYIPVKDKEGIVCMYECVAGEYVYYTSSGTVNGIEE